MSYIIRTKTLNTNLISKNSCYKVMRGRKHHTVGLVLTSLKVL